MTSSVGTGAGRRGGSRTVGAQGHVEPPDPGRMMLLRPRLLAALQARFHVRLTTVTAGPGFGKTTLLAQAAAENRLAPRGLDVWLTCTSGDSAASSLARSLSDAFRLPGPDTWNPDVVVGRVEAAVWAASPQQVVLVIDEAHLVDRASAGGELLSTVLQRLPDNGHMLLATRDRLPVATARLASMGQLTELREPDLGFTSDEICEFADLRGVGRTLLDPLGGWPALVELAASTGEDRMLDYLWEELLGSLDDQRCRDLALLAAVPYLDDEIASAVVDHPLDLSATLADLPLVSGRPGSQRALHPLWQPALAHLVGANEIPAARTRAAEVLQQRGQVEAAVDLLLQAEDWAKVRGVACEVALQTHPVVAPDVIEQWYRALPPDQRRTPEGGLMQATVLRAHDLDRALPVFQLAAERFEEAGDVIGVVASLTHAAHIAWWLDDVDSVEQASRRVERYAEDLPLLAGVAALGRALAADARGDVQGALDLLGTLDPSLLPPAMLAGLDWMWAWEWLLAGRPERAGRYADAAVHGASGTFLAPALNVQVLSRWLAGERAAALELVTDLADATHATGRDLGTVFERSQCALVMAFAGRVDDACAHLAAAGVALPGAGQAPMAEIAHALGEASVLVASGDEERAAGVIGVEVSRRPVVPAGATRWHALFPALTYVLAPEARRRWDTASLGPAQELARDLARALVAVRSTGDVQAAAALPWDSSAALFGGHLPVPWLVELAVAAVAGGATAAATCVEELGARGSPWLRRLTTGTHPAVAGAAKALVAAQPAAPLHHLELRLLGPLELRRDGVRVDHPDLRRERVRQLLQYLVFRSPVSRAAVGAELWPDLTPDSAARNLRVTLSYLQGVLQPERDEGAPPWFLRADGNMLVLRRGDSLEVDVLEFEAALAAAQQAESLAAPSLALQHLQRALPYYRGEALTELADSDWAGLESDRLRVRFVTAAVRCGELLLATGNKQDPLALAQRALRADPWSESAYVLQSAAHLERGELDAARHTYRRCLQMLAELGLPPGPSLQMVARRLQPIVDAQASSTRVRSSPRAASPRPSGVAHGKH
jgi:LuxR family maltose regulon positive regulatory protein